MRSIFYILLILLPINGVAQCSSVECQLPIPNIPQQNNNWCWAASIQMVLQFHGISSTQCDVVGKGKMVVCCHTDTNNDPCLFESSTTNCNQKLPSISIREPWRTNDISTNSGIIMRAVTAFTYGSPPKNLVVDLKDVTDYIGVKTAIQNGNPAIALVTNGSAHVVVIKGFFTFSGKLYWIVNNPLNLKQASCDSCTHLIEVDTSNGTWKRGKYSIVKYLIVRK